MEMYQVKSLTEITKEDCDDIKLHMTCGALRRSASTAYSIIVIPATDNIPTLYYVKDQNDPILYKEDGSEWNPEVDGWINTDKLKTADGELWDPMVNGWSIHAVTSDILRYLLKKSIA